MVGSDALNESGVCVGGRGCLLPPAPPRVEPVVICHKAWLGQQHLVKFANVIRVVVGRDDVLKVEPDRFRLPCTDELHRVSVRTLVAPCAGSGIDQRRGSRR